MLVFIAFLYLYISIRERRSSTSIKTHYLFRNVCYIGAMSVIEVEPQNFSLAGGDDLLIEQLPADYRSAESFIRVENAGCIASYVGQLCLADGNERPMTVEDTKGLYDVDDASFVRELATLADQGFDLEGDQGRLLLRACLSINNGWQTVGALNMVFGKYVYSRDPDWQIDTQRIIGRLHEIDVQPDFGRRGIGSRMLAVALDVVIPQFPNPEAALRLNVYRNNTPARAWYDKIGLLLTGNAKRVSLPSGVKVDFEERSGRLQTVRSKLLTIGYNGTQ